LPRKRLKLKDQNPQRNAIGKKVITPVNTLEEVNPVLGEDPGG
jgi:hypothetical protein